MPECFAMPCVKKGIRLGSSMTSCPCTLPCSTCQCLLAKGAVCQRPSGACLLTEKQCTRDWLAKTIDEAVRHPAGLNSFFTPTPTTPPSSPSGPSTPASSSSGPTTPGGTTSTTPMGSSGPTTPSGPSTPMGDFAFPGGADLCCDHAAVAALGFSSVKAHCPKVMTVADSCGARMCRCVLGSCKAHSRALATLQVVGAETSPRMAAASLVDAAQNASSV